MRLSSAMLAAAPSVRRLRVPVTAGIGEADRRGQATRFRTTMQLRNVRRGHGLSHVLTRMMVCKIGWRASGHERHCRATTC